MGRLVWGAAGMVAAAMVWQSQASAQTHVTFWQFSTREADIAAWKGAIAAFEKQDPDVVVDMEIVPWAEQQQRLVNAVTTGGLPDVSMLGNDVVSQFQALGALASLDSYMAAYGAAKGYDVAGDIWAGDADYYHIAGHWWGTPIAVETRVLYYRKDLMRKVGLDPAAPPQTWDSMLHAAGALTHGLGGKVYGWGAPMGLDYFTVQTFMSVYLGYGARMLDADGHCGFDSPEFRAALDTYTHAYLDGDSHPDSPNMDGGTFRRNFLDGRFAMLIDSPELYRDVRRENPAWAADLGVAPVPAGPKGRFGFLGGWPLVLWNTSEHKDAAAKWMLFASRPEGGLKALATDAGFLPGSRKLAQAAPWDRPPYDLVVAQLRDAKPYQYPSEAIPQMGQIEVDTMQKAVQAVALKQQTVAEASKALCSAMGEVLAR